MIRVRNCKIGLLLCSLCGWIINPVLAASAAIIDTILTDNIATTDLPIKVKDTFSQNTPVIYVIWTSDKLQAGQKVKIVWIADDTNNVAAANYKIDSMDLLLDKDGKGSLSSTLPDNSWGGHFMVTKPTNGWPLGKYHAELYVDGELATKVPFTITERKLE